MRILELLMWAKVKRKKCIMFIIVKLNNSGILVAELHDIVNRFRESEEFLYTKDKAENQYRMAVILWPLSSN